MAAPAECNLDLVEDGLFLRTMECGQFVVEAGGSPAWDIAWLNATMPKFDQVFERCALFDLMRRGSKKHSPCAASFVRHDLPLKAYADGFGYMIRAGADAVDCSYAFDAYKGSGRRKRCMHAREELVHMRLRIVQSACKNAAKRLRTSTASHMFALWAQSRDETINCCYSNMSDALWSQKRYLELSEHTACTRGNGLNQFQMRWRPENVVGVFYMKDSQLPFARRMYALASSHTLKMAGESGGVARPLTFCKLPLRF